MAAMQIVTDRAGEQRVESGVRPFDIGRDLRPVARLIAEAFADELDEQGEAALRELRILSHMSGLIRLLSRSTGELQDVFNGFVWVENGKLVGNVTVQRAANHSGRWQIANVAVSPAYRGRGISRVLMETALEYVREMNGTWAVLQVRADNRVARGLYERMAFENMGGTTEMYVERAPKVTAAPTIPGLQPFSPSDSTLLYELAASQQDAEAQWWRSVRRAEFEVSIERCLGEWLSRLIGREHVYRMAIRDFKSRFEAALLLTARRWRGEHSIKLWVRPETGDQYQRQLVLWALAKLQDYPIWPVKATVSTTQTGARAALEEQGFHERSTLLTMRKRIR